MEHSPPLGVVIDEGGDSLGVGGFGRADHRPFYARAAWRIAQSFADRRGGEMPTKQGNSL